MPLVEPRVSGVSGPQVFIAGFVCVVAWFICRGHWFAVDLAAVLGYTVYVVAMVLSNDAEGFPKTVKTSGRAAILLHLCCLCTVVAMERFIPLAATLFHQRPLVQMNLSVAFAILTILAIVVVAQLERIQLLRDPANTAAGPARGPRDVI